MIFLSRGLPACDALTRLHFLRRRRVGPWRSEVVYKQIGRLIEANPVQSAEGQFGSDPPPDGYRQIFRRRHASAKFSNFFVEEAVVEDVQHLARQYLLEVFQVHHQSGTRINLSLNGDLQDVVVSMAVRVVSLAEDAPVFLGRKFRAVVIVRGGKLRFPCEINHKFMVYGSPFNIP